MWGGGPLPVADAQSATGLKLRQRTDRGTNEPGSTPNPSAIGFGAGVVDGANLAKPVLVLESRLSALRYRGELPTTLFELAAAVAGTRVVAANLGRGPSKRGECLLGRTAVRVGTASIQSLHDVVRTSTICH